MSIHNKRNRLLTVVVAWLVANIGCSPADDPGFDVVKDNQDVSDDPQESDVSAPLTMRISSPVAVETKALSQEELDHLLNSCPVFVADGELEADCGALLTAEYSEIALMDGTIDLEANGRSIRPAVADGENDLVEIKWDEDFRDIALQFQGGTSKIELLGIEDISVRKRIIGAISAQAFTQGQSLEGMDEENAAVGICVVAVVIAVAWIACVLYEGCASKAIKACKGKGGVFKYKKVCGAGYDVEGSFELGYSCSWQCNTCSI
jgi:hypothetical protein